MNISVIGTGYVGLVTGSCLSDFGFNVICMDTDKDKIDLLKHGEIPIYEPGLKDLVDRNVLYKRLIFTNDIEYAVENSQVIFIAVGTPPLEDGSADLSYVLDVARNIGRYITNYKVIVVKSTVPTGTNKKVKEMICYSLDERGIDAEFDVVSNPEFLRQGSAVYDCTHPDRVIIGSDSHRAVDIMKEVYRILYLNETPFLITNAETAELIKYATNAFLATKITFINEMANLCEKTGANVKHIAKAMGMDGRIGSKFLHPGPGFGGSCFPKDTQALVKIGSDFLSPMTIVQAVVAANDNQKLIMVKKLEEALGSLRNKTIGILGLAFKPNTNDMREAPALTIIEKLVLDHDARIQVFDPHAMEEAQNYFCEISSNVQYCKDPYEVCKSSDALVILTEWNEFRKLDLKKVKELMNLPYFFDLRNIYDRFEVEREGLIYHGVGV